MIFSGKCFEVLLAKFQKGYINDINNLSEILKRNMSPKWLIKKSVKSYLSKVRTTGKDASKCETSNCHFYKLPYIGKLLLLFLHWKENFIYYKQVLQRLEMLKLFSLLFSRKTTKRFSLKSMFRQKLLSSSFN